MIELSGAHISPEDFRLNRQWFIKPVSGYIAFQSAGDDRQSM